MIVCLLLPLQWGGVLYPWNDRRIVAPFCVVGAIFVILTVSDHHVSSASFSLSLSLGNSSRANVQCFLCSYSVGAHKLDLVWPCSSSWWRSWHLVRHLVARWTLNLPLLPFQCITSLCFSRQVGSSRCSHGTKYPPGERSHSLAVRHRYHSVHARRGSGVLRFWRNCQRNWSLPDVHYNRPNDCCRRNGALIHHQGGYVRRYSRMYFAWSRSHLSQF